MFYLLAFEKLPTVDSNTCLSIVTPIRRFHICMLVTFCPVIASIL